MEAKESEVENLPSKVARDNKKLQIYIAEESEHSGGESQITIADETIRHSKL